jgi:Holliday junction resolvasome RuvABC DNA-binding subunit
MAKPKVSETSGGTSEGVIKETFAALLSVGHTEEKARAAIDNVMKSGQRFDSVSEMIDAVYAASSGIHTMPRVVPAGRRDSKSRAAMSATA